MTPPTDDPIALFDLDGTVADFPGAMRSALRRLASPGETYYYEEQEDEPPHITERRRMIKRQPGFWRNLEPFQLGFDVLDICVRLNYAINVLTKAPKNNYPAWAEKAEWCDRHLTQRRKIEHKITMSEDKGLVYGRVLVDDWPKYVVRWLAHRPRGLVIMPAHDYNASFSHPQVIRYDGRNEEAVRIALEIAAARKAL